MASKMAATNDIFKISICFQNSFATKIVKKMVKNIQIIVQLTGLNNGYMTDNMFI